MKNREFIEYFFPPIFLENAYNLFTYFDSLKYLTSLKKNKFIKDSFVGEECLILGNAPSLNGVDLNKIKDKKIFVMNNFYLHENFKQLISKNEIFYVSAPIHPPQTNREWENDYLIKILNSTKESIKLFFGLNYKKNNIKKIIDNSKEINFIERKKDIFYFYAGFYSKYPFVRNVKINLQRRIYGANTASLYALQIAIFMGFKKINFLGVDHSVICKRELNDAHFYSLPLILNKIKRLSNKFLCLDTLNSFNLYEKIKNNNPCVKIYNLSKESLLDMFQFRDFDDFLKSKENSKE